MNRKFNLTKISWKFKLILVVAVSLAAVILLKLPTSQAQANDESVQKGVSQSADKKITRFPNGVTKIEPQGFAVTGAVRDMPTLDPDALVNRANFISSEERREKQIKDERIAKGVNVGEDEEEINKQNAERVKTIIPGAGAGFDAFEDPLVKKEKNTYAPESMPTPSLTFDGATQADNASLGIGALSPPDVNGDVGPNNYVSSVNLVLKIFNKSGAVVAGPIKTSSLFASLPAGDPCRVQNDGDPVVLYDTLADRWHVSQFALPSGSTKYQCVALSVTGDPTGAYYVWSYPYPGGEFNDYPKVGVWTDAYHMTFNQFDNSGNTFLGAGFLSQDRKKALVGDPTASVVYFNLNTVDPTSGGLLPGDIDGYVAPPPGLAEVIGEYRATEFGDPNDALRLYRWAPNFTDPASSSLTVLPDVVLAPFDARQPTTAAVEQMGGTNLDALADRSMHRFAYRNFGTSANPVNSYVGNFTVNVSGENPTTAATYQTGIRWFEIRRVNDTFSVFDQGTHNLIPGDGANGLNNWMGSIAQDNAGDIALGFSQAGTTQKADIKIAGRTNNVKDSGTLNEGETLFYPAGGSQLSTANRWGDYSAMNVDPSDDCTFWYTQEYYAVTSNTGWSTRVGKFRYPQCTDAPKATITGTISYCNSGAPASGASVDATGGFNRVTAALGTYSMTVSPGTYTVSAGKSGGFNTVSASPVTVAGGGNATVNICLVGSPVISSATPQIVSESCSIPNGAPDPGEQITISLPLQNTGAASTNNLTATLRATGGVTNPSPASQSYGAIAPGSAATTRNFSFIVDSGVTCGSNITLTFDITDGATSYGTVTQSYTTGVRSLTLSENFDSVTTPALPTGWSNVQTAGTGINWTTTTNIPSSAPNNAFANEAATVNATALVSPSVVIQTTDAQISFKNFYNTEASTSSTGAGFDGMVLEYSTNGGTTWIDVITGGGSFVSGGYNRTISSGFSSPISGRNAWSGNSGGYLDTLINLPASLNGQTVKFRWLMASDSSTTGVGVRIDNVQILGSRQCSASCSQSYEGDVQSRPSGDGFVDSDDIQQIRRFSVGLDLPYQSNEFQRADCSPRTTSGDGFVDSDDVQQARRYSVGLDSKQSSGGQTGSLLFEDWQETFKAKSTRSRTDSANTTAQSITNNTATESITQSTESTAQRNSPEAGRAVRIVNQSTSPGQTITVPINVDTTGDETGYTFSIAFDQTKLSATAVTIGSLGGNVTSNINNTTGTIGFSITSFSGTNGVISAATDQSLVTITFTVAGNASQGMTNITFTDNPARRKVSGIDPNTALPQPTFTDGTVSISGPTAATVTVGGRVKTPAGRGISGVRVSLTDSNGQIRTAITTSFGYYQFENVQTGETYILSAKAKHFTFNQPTQLLNATDETNNIDFIAYSQR